MITITLITQDGCCIGFHAIGHAEYAPKGYDIVCAAVSGLTQGTAVAIQKLTEKAVEIKKESGLLSLIVKSPDTMSSVLLLGFMIAINDLSKEYPDHIKVCLG